MIEKVVLDYLKKNMAVPVYMEEPEEPPESYLLLEKTGGGCQGPLREATIIIQSYASTLENAAKLNEKIKRAMEDIDNQNPISRAELNSDYNYTDTITKRYRYQAVYDLTYY